MSTRVSTETANHSRAAIVSDVYHAMAQPLTELHGALELALARESDTNQLRDAVRRGLAAADRAMASLCFLRDLADAEQPGAVESLDLSEAIREVVEEFRPVAESQQVTFLVNIAPGIRIYANRSRLTEALTRIADCVIATVPSAVRLEPVMHGFKLRVEGARLCDWTAAQSRSLELARTLLNAVHCRLEVTDDEMVVTASGDDTLDDRKEMSREAAHTIQHEVVPR